MKLQVFLVFLVLCFKGSYSTISSYPSPGDGWSFLCGCGSRNQYNNNIQMKCKDDHVIQMEPRGYLMRESIGSSGIDCGKFNFSTCKKSRQKVLDLENRIEIYKKCTLKNSCDINIAGVQEGKQRLVNYPFYCHSVNAFNDISMKRDINPYAPILYLTGENHTGQKIDCDCVVTGPDNIVLNIYFIHLKPTSCSKVKFLSRNVSLFGCSTYDTTILKAFSKVKTELKLKIRDFEPDKEDIIFFRLLGKDLSVNCNGCSSAEAESSTFTSEGRSMTFLKTTDQPNTDIPVATDSATGRSISAGNTDHSNNDNYPALIGGVLAAIISIIIVGIGIYCYIRIRRKRQRTPNDLHVAIKGNISQNNYDEIADCDIQGSSHTGDSTISKTQNDRPKNNNFDPVNSKNKISGSNNQCHMLEMANFSTPFSARIDNGAKQKAGNQKNDDYDHISNGTKAKISKPIHDDTYNHIDTTANHTLIGDDYDHIGNQNGDPLDSKSKPKISGSNNHVLEIDNYSTPLNSHADDGEQLNSANHAKHNGAKIKAGNQKVKKDDYDHISNGTKAKISQPIHDDTYNHIDAKMTPTTGDDYNSIGNVNFDPGESTSSKHDTESTEDVDTYNHLQNDL